MYPYHLKFWDLIVAQGEYDWLAGFWVPNTCDMRCFRNSNGRKKVGHKLRRIAYMSHLDDKIYPRRIQRESVSFFSRDNADASSISMSAGH
jgi:hypothetical protein